MWCSFRRFRISLRRARVTASLQHQELSAAPPRNVRYRRKSGKHLLMLRFSQFDPMLSKKSKIERLRKSREDQFFVVSAAASLCRACTKVCDRFCVIRCGPSRCHAWDAPAALKNFVRQPEKTFSTASTPIQTLRVQVDRVPVSVFDYRRLSAPSTVRAMSHNTAEQISSEVNHVGSASI